MDEFWGISRTELTETLCELLGWKRPNGRLKGVEYRQFLKQLETSSVIRLPEPRQGKPRGARAKVGRSKLGKAQQSIHGGVKRIGRVSLRKAGTAKDRALWKERVDRYQYLGFKTRFGACLRYLIQLDGPYPPTLSCLQFSSPT